MTDTQVMSIDALNAFLVRVFPQVSSDFLVEEVTSTQATLRLRVGEHHLRPGGTVSGPAMFGLADVTMYVLTLAQVGPKALAVTTNCSIDFLRKPNAGCDLLCKARLLKLGKQLAVGDALIFSEGDDAPVARASLTYALPPRGSAADVDA